MKLKKGDTVKLLSGKDSGKTGKVLLIDRETQRIVVEGVNMRKKHLKPRRQGEKGEMAHKPGTMNISNAILICPSCGKPTRVGFKIEGSLKSRICKKCQIKI